MTTIYLIRHATPDVGNPYCDYAQAVELLNEYNQTVKLRLEETCVAPSFEELPIYSSPLPRAKLTAETLFPTRTILFDERLQEFNLTISPIKWLKCRFQHWLAISRLLWFLGLHQCGNTPKQEKQRIADFMQQHLLESSIMVAHCFVLREIKNPYTSRDLPLKKSPNWAVLQLNAYQNKGTSGHIPQKFYPSNALNDIEKQAIESDKT